VFDHKGPMNRPVSVDELDYVYDRLLKGPEAALQFGQSVPKLSDHHSTAIERSRLPPLLYSQFTCLIERPE
jgi:hypothetical protein